MKVVVLGGSGLQGRAALQDLGNSEDVKKVICADVSFEDLDSFSRHLNMEKIEKREVDATSAEELEILFAEDIDIVIDLLPKQFNDFIAKIAIKTDVSLVNCSYANGLSDEVFEKAKEKGVSIMPESGLDPGIDLVLCGYGVNQLDEVHEMYSYCGGVPEANAADNILKYKISWNLDSIMMSYKRPSVMKRNGEIVNITAKEQHNKDWINNITVSGIQGLESIPNGDAMSFAETLGIDHEVINMERRSIRWSGHAQVLRDIKELGLLETEPVEGIEDHITPYEFMKKHLEPRLQYKKDEKDLVLMKNIIRGKKNGQSQEIIYEMLDKRDSHTGLFAMNRTVGYTASIVAQMVANGTISRRGVLSPTTDIPHKLFIDEINKRGITIKETKRQLNKSFA
ncbi:saccharopine dehydrogenase family protein [Virgibacillus siamensis]|uniref:saccharopine dehydrogenase family protein n=1 Tax=Virgibacillus siamensis TaxID=480071 RepID=UPI000987AB9A|nr:saccharopine dehydrogenase C-terminal domain-containing protein [Virgibacillus siamensis]